MSSGPGVDSSYSGEDFARLSKMKGEWDIHSEVKIAFDFFEESKAEAEIEVIDNTELVLEECFDGYFKEDKWMVNTRYKLVGQDSLEVIVSDTRDSTAQFFTGTFIEGFLSVISQEGDKKMEMRLFEDRMEKKVFVTTITEVPDWELVLYWEYTRD